MKSHFFKAIQLIIITASLFVFTNKSSYGQSKSWEGTLVIPTYGFQSDINPKFWAMDAGRRSGPKIYPYTMQDDLGRELKNVTYRALFVENEYLKVTMLPELGGRIFSVLDKTTNKDMFYMNPVIKPSNIAMRGAFYCRRSGMECGSLKIIPSRPCLLSTGLVGPGTLTVRPTLKWAIWKGVFEPIGW